MNLATVKRSISLAIKRILAYVPEPMPESDAAMEAWVTRVIEIAGQDPKNDSLRNAVASMVMHKLQETQLWATKRQFAKSVHRALVQQAAYNVTQAVRDRAKAADEQAKSSQA